MKFTRNILLMLAGAFAVCQFVQAQATRTWVSGVGDDANPCSRTAPCKTWAGAISKTATGGEIDALDPGGFGAVTITKSITIDGGGGQVASILVSGTNGITVSVPTGSVVNLHNLRFQGIYGDGGSSGLSGIELESGGVLHIDHCEIYGFQTSGVYVNANANAWVFINDSTFEDNADGIYATTSSGLAHVVVTNSHVSDNSSYGIFAADNSVVTVHNSTSDGNGIAGFAAIGSTSAASMYLINSSASANGAEGALAGGGGATSTIYKDLNTTFTDNPHPSVTGVKGYISNII